MKNDYVKEELNDYVKKALLKYKELTENTKDKLIPITTNQFEELLHENEKLQETVEKQKNDIEKLEEKYENKNSQFRSIQGKYSALLRKNKDEIREELKEELTQGIEESIKFRLENEYRLIEIKLRREYEDRIEKKVNEKICSIENYQKKIVDEVKEEYTRYLDESDNAGERATGYLIALRKFQKISEGIIKEDKNNKTYQGRLL